MNNDQKEQPNRVYPEAPGTQPAMPDTDKKKTDPNNPTFSEQPTEVTELVKNPVSPKPTNGSDSPAGKVEKTDSSDEEEEETTETELPENLNSGKN